MTLADELAYEFAAPTGSDRTIARRLSVIVESYMRELLENEDLPRISQSGVRYLRDPARERHPSIATMIRSRSADAEDLTAWRIAELRNAGHEAFFVFVRGLRSSTHFTTVVVGRHEGPLTWIEDPTLTLRTRGRQRGEKSQPSMPLMPLGHGR